MVWLKRILLIALCATACNGVAFSVSANDDVLTHQQQRDAYRVRYAQPPAQALEVIDEWLQSSAASETLWEIKAELHMLNLAEVNVFRKRGQLRQSIQAFEEVVAINPSAYRAQALLYALYRSLPGILGGDEDKAKAKEAELTVLGDGMLAYARALQAMLNEEKESGIELLQQAIDEAPENADYHIALVRLLIDMDEWDKARAQLDASLALHGDYQPLVYQGVRYHILTETVDAETEETIEWLLAESARAPARLLPESVYLMRGRAHQLAGNLQEAARDYRYVQQRTPLLISDMGFDVYVENSEVSSTD